jgi:hypothetical protein
MWKTCSFRDTFLISLTERRVSHGSGHSWSMGFHRRHCGVTWVLAILGLVVGFLNVSTTEPQRFLLAAVALTLSASAILSLPVVGFVLTNILANAVAFTAAAMLVVAIRALLETAKG